jgi:hypothetical protein
MVRTKKNGNPGWFNILGLCGISVKSALFDEETDETGFFLLAEIFMSGTFTPTGDVVS